jgi:EAL domain-containing protein (putative c-di-GMP-specific phosphodiesterase class I)
MYVAPTGARSNNNPVEGRGALSILQMRQGFLDSELALYRSTLGGFLHCGTSMITESEIDEGLRRNEFLLYYQPKISLVTGRIIGAEALIRWARSDGSITSPLEFIPVAEKSQLIKRVTGYIFQRLVDDMPYLGSMNDLTVSFNVSARDFEDMVLARKILESIGTNRMTPESFEVEITETQALMAGQHVMDNIALLCDAGIGLTMDDYGTGYSSIDNLSKWPFTTIKLDQGIVGRMLASEKNATIVRSSIRLGHELKVNVVAEGVETSEQYQFLLEAGCKTVQGYLVSKPLPLEEFIAFRSKATASSSFPIGLVHMAIMDHVQWRRQIVSYVAKRSALPPDSPIRRSTGYPPTSCHECSLGRWYFGVGQVFSEHSAFIALDMPHRALHETGLELIRQVQEGASPHDIAPLLKDLQACSTTLVSLLECLEDIALTDLYRLH